MPYKDKQKQLEYQRQWIAKRRSSFFLDKKCVKCNSTEDLELDHKDPETKVDHRIWSWSEERRNKEIAKCQILCQSCHTDKTWTDDGRSRAQHGSDTMYSKYKCRCELCRSARSIYKEARRAERKALGLPRD